MVISRTGHFDVTVLLPNLVLWLCTTNVSVKRPKLKVIVTRYSNYLLFFLILSAVLPATLAWVLKYKEQLCTIVFLFSANTLLYEVLKALITIIS